jgi:hypothetical protein
VRPDGGSGVMQCCLWWVGSRPTQAEALRALEAMEHGNGDARGVPSEGVNQGRWLCWESVAGELCAAHLPALERKARSNAPLIPLHSLTLLPGEHVVQVGALSHMADTCRLFLRRFTHMTPVLLSSYRGSLFVSRMVLLQKK